MSGVGGRAHDVALALGTVGREGRGWACQMRGGRS
ncbi:hypothetical protein GGD63_001905 [Bradyrhizobium sp. cir1]|nr:hypothetical protein [Bradyrhizobium sp. cir1]